MICGTVISGAVYKCSLGQVYKCPVLYNTKDQIQMVHVSVFWCNMSWVLVRGSNHKRTSTSKCIRGLEHNVYYMYCHKDSYNSSYGVHYFKV